MQTVLFIGLFAFALVMWGAAELQKRVGKQSRNLDMAENGNSMVPGARIELATPAFSGRRSTNELPRQIRTFQF